ncbi:MAG: hypothetical protein SGJ20_02255 [Planctomycetota bacterium]|nr:hypothetical protein [Planctomycetota bacterium]
MQTDGKIEKSLPPLIIEETAWNKLDCVEFAKPRQTIPARPFRPLPHKETVVVTNGIEILLVEDNANDEMLALHEFKKSNICNQVHVVRDGN